jgi:signal transduction histidine kinase
MYSPWRKYRKPAQPAAGSGLRIDRFYEGLFRAAPGPYLILKSDAPRFTIVEVNDAYLAATNTRRSDLIGRALFAVFPDNPEDAGATGERNLGESLATVLSTGRPHEMAVQKYDIPRPPEQGGGFEERYWSPLNTPVFNEERELTHIIHYVEDVTELAHLARLREMEGERVVALRNRNEWLEEEIHRRRVAEAELDMAVHRERLAREDADRARRSAEEANHFKSEFIAKMSHELRTPLNAIGGYAQLLEMGVRGKLTDDQCEFLRRIRSSEEHLLTLINQILDLARVESGKEHYEITHLQVKPILVRVEELITPQMMAKQIALSVEDVASELIVHADPDKLRQILLNLMSNAIKNTPPGGRIAASCAADRECVRISIEDTGRGIPAGQLEKIFEPFVQVADGSGEGVGLGLPISREFARAMGGDLTVTSVPGNGATFVLRLPRGAGRSGRRAGAA